MIKSLRFGTVRGCGTCGQPCDDDPRICWECKATRFPWLLQTPGWIGLGHRAWSWRSIGTSEVARILDACPPLVRRVFLWFLDEYRAGRQPSAARMAEEMGLPPIVVAAWLHCGLATARAVVFPWLYSLDPSVSCFPEDLTG